MHDNIGGTGLADHVTAWASFKDEAKAAGYILGPADYHPSQDWSKLVAWLEKGNGATIAIDYGRVPKPIKGDPVFDGNHAVFLSAIRTRGSVTEIRVWDPLCDGRRQGIPRGPIWYKAVTLKNAAGGYAGDGRASWVGVKKAEAIAPETPPADCKTELDAARQRIEVLTTALESARSLLTNANQEIGRAHV